MYRYIFLLFLSPLIYCAPHLHIQHVENLFADEKIHIQVDGLTPSEQVEIKAEMKDAGGNAWSSHAFFVADATGHVDVAAQDTIGQSSYTGVDEMGLFWSMTPSMDAKQKIFKAPSDKIETTLSLYVQGELKDQKRCVRLMKQEGIAEIDARQAGLAGTLFLPKSKAPLPVVIILSSSSGEIPEGKARLLASRGYGALALGYFGKEGVPKKLKNIPLEYFEKAFTWIKTQKELDGERIFLYGTSRGAELALILGAQFPDKVHGLIATVPSSVVFAGLSLFPSCAWQYGGKPALPFATLCRPHLLKGEGLTKAKPARLRETFIDAMQKNKDFKSAAIPTEKITCPLLLISAGDDQMWPSDVFAEKIVERMKKHSPNHPIYHYNFPHAGHGITLPYLPMSEPLYYHPAVKLWFMAGGSKDANAKASSESWEKILAFLEEVAKQKEAAI